VPPRGKITVEASLFYVAIMFLCYGLRHLRQPNAAFPHPGRPQGLALAIGGIRPMPRHVPPHRQTAYVGSLTQVLHRVADHADQPDSGSHRRIPASIDYPIQLGGRYAIHIAHRELMDRAVILPEKVTAYADLSNLLRALAVAGSPLAKGQAEPLPPFRPNLLDVRQIGDMIVLDAAQVPDEPGDRVRSRIWAVGRHLVRKAVGEVDDEPTYSPEGIQQQLLRMITHVTER